MNFQESLGLEIFAVSISVYKLYPLRNFSILPIRLLLPTSKSSRGMKHTGILAKIKPPAAFS